MRSGNSGSAANQSRKSACAVADLRAFDRGEGSPRGGGRGGRGRIEKLDAIIALCGAVGGDL